MQRIVLLSVCAQTAAEAEIVIARSGRRRTVLNRQCRNTLGSKGPDPMAVFASDQWNDRLAAWRASPAKAYGAAVALVALASGLRAATAPVTGACDPFTAYFPAV